MSSSVIPPPSLVFIVPYRDREQHYLFFDNHMRKTVLASYDPTTYQILYVHQNDSREFNRGALKNLGFLWIKNTYPTDYSNITLVFNDVDTMPYTANFLNYSTTAGIVKHFYGFTFALGGIVSIVASDFEKIGGFPNFWAWGFEDNELQRRVLDKGLQIDRSHFFPFQDKNILQLKDNLLRSVNRNEYQRFRAKTNEGFQSITAIEWKMDDTSGFLNVSAFQTGVVPKSPNTFHDIRKGSVPFPTAPNHNRATMKMNF